MLELNGHLGRCMPRRNLSWLARAMILSCTGVAFKTDHPAKDHRGQIEQDAGLGREGGVSDSPLSNPQVAELIIPAGHKAAGGSLLLAMIFPAHNVLHCTIAGITSL